MPVSTALNVSYVTIDHQLQTARMRGVRRARVRCGWPLTVLGRVGSDARGCIWGSGNLRAFEGRRAAMRQAHRVFCTGLPFEVLRRSNAAMYFPFC